MEMTMVEAATPTWKIYPNPAEQPPGPMIRRKGPAEYVQAWWHDCIHHGFQIDPEYLPGMVEGYDYGGTGLWKEWMTANALHASFLHWCEDMKIDRIELLQMSKEAFATYFQRFDRVHTKRKQRLFLKNNNDPRLSYRGLARVIYFEILPAHKEAFFK